MQSRMALWLVAGSAFVLMMGAVGFLALPVSASTEVVETIRVSVASNGAQANDDSWYSEVSADGSTVVYDSKATNLVAGDTNGYEDVFAFDVATGATTRVSVASNGTQGNRGSFDPEVSDDGSTIVYESWASNLVAGDTNGTTYDVFAFDVASGATTAVSVASSGTHGNGMSWNPAISGDGSTIVYGSEASNLVPGDTNGFADVFAFDVASGTTTLVSVASDGTQGNGYSVAPAISSDGSTIVYYSGASTLVAGDTNGVKDVFAFDVASGTTTLVSVASSGAQGNDDSYAPAVSGDGSTIVYWSEASTLVAGDTNGVRDVFAYNTNTGSTTRISVASDGVQADEESSYPAVSGDGSLIVYESWGRNLVVGDTNHTPDIFAYDVASGATIRVSVASDGTQTTGLKHSTQPAVSGDGSFVAYQSNASNLVEGDTNNADDVFLTRLSRPTKHVGRFIDDDGSVFEADIEWMAAMGITKGCNPPDNTRFCPDSPVTRGQMAAFLVRALDLNDRLNNPFTDDDGSVFEADIERLAAAGITKGCNPPVNDRFCPTGNVTRGQMAAFLVRALKYTDDGGGDLFADDDDSIFEADIDRLGTAGVTKGCNPPTNDRYCPNGNVTRGQMAAFLHRALG